MKMQLIDDGRFPDKMLLVAETAAERESLEGRQGKTIRGRVVTTDGEIGGFRRPGDEEVMGLLLEIPEPE